MFGLVFTLLHSMKIISTQPSSKDFPKRLQDIPDPPKQLYSLGPLKDLLENPLLSVVGSRKVTPYGRSVTNKLSREAAEQGIVIVSGLALGVDAIAHSAALEAGSKTIAVMPCGLDTIYPASHRNLAEQILRSGGALISEYPSGTAPFKNNFIARNRIVSGISDGVLITEAAIKSGSLHTANFALDQGKTVMAVPGNITNEQSVGTNNLIKMGAVPVTELRNILSAMGLEQKQKNNVIVGINEHETQLLTLISAGVTDGARLLIESKLDPQVFNHTLTMLEITDKIRPSGAGHWALS